MATILGSQFIGFRRSSSCTKSFQAFNPKTGATLSGHFTSATPDELQDAMSLAWNAQEPLSLVNPAQRASFLRRIGENILDRDHELIKLASEETGLPETRIISERGRTIGQINLFADLVLDGSWVEATIDTALPDRQPLPKPDIRRMLRPIGPVVVFGSSNFPLAFSVAGGDTISALAAGNPVVVKAHPAHPGTSVIVAECIIQAALSTGMPEGVFSMLFDGGYETGTALVTHPHTRAVGFTGSFTGGMALFRLAQSRPDPIPFFAEMGSVNPIFLMPGCFSQGIGQMAKNIAGSVTLGAGQFCTNPGVLFIPKTEETDGFLKNLAEEISNSLTQTMLSISVAHSYATRKNQQLAVSGVNLLGKSGAGNSDCDGEATVALTDAKTFLTNPTLAQEVFGPFSLAVIYSDEQEALLLAERMEGQLTSTVFHGQQDDSAFFGRLIRILERKSGRIVINGVPTGVEVCPAMHHGGPFPASTDSRFTSVGTYAVKRFARPVSYQNFPGHMLPEELHDHNPLNIRRIKNGKPE